MRSLPAMLLAALMLPALLLPVDATLCICSLFGAPAAASSSSSSSCCSRPCCRPATSTQPSVRAQGCGGCRVSTLDRATIAPSTDRTDVNAAAASAPAVFDDSALAPPLHAPRVDSFLREELRRPPPLLARAQPLRL